jgi:hypothetical protein
MIEVLAKISSILYLEFDDSGKINTKIYDKRGCQSSTKLSEVNVKDTFTSHIDKKIV